MTQALTELHVASRLQDIREDERRAAVLWLHRQRNWERRLDALRRACATVT